MSDFVDRDLHLNYNKTNKVRFIEFLLYVCAVSKLVCDMHKVLIEVGN